jgi:hypothetical protein
MTPAAPRLGSIPVAAERQGRHHYHMGLSGNLSSIKDDLFSAQQSPEMSSSSGSEPKSLPLRKDEPVAPASPSYALPTNLPSALSHVDDDQLDRLLAAVISKLKQRGKKLPVSNFAQTVYQRGCAAFGSSENTPSKLVLDRHRSPNSLGFPSLMLERYW